MRTGKLGYVAPQQKARAKAAARRPPAPPISPHLIAPGQGVLFGARRDWSCFAKGTLDQLPSLTPAAQARLEDFRQHVEARGLDEQVRRIAARSLRILLAWIGAEAPIHEADIRALPADRRGTSARHVLGFLQQRGLVAPDPARQAGIHQQAIERRLEELPAAIAGELRCWARVLRGEGRREHRPMSFETIRKYLGYLGPVLASGPARSPACGRSSETTSAPSSSSDQGSPAWTWPARCAAYSRRSSRNGSFSATPPAGSPRQQSYAFPSRSPPTGSAA